MGSEKITSIEHPKIGKSYNQFGFPSETKAAKKAAKRKDVQPHWTVFTPDVHSMTATNQVNQKKPNCVFTAVRS